MSKNIKGLTSYIRMRNQRGISSIVIVFVLMILVTLVSLGFAKLMSRALQGSVTHQQAAAAGYAAQSGIRNVTAWVKAEINAGQEIKSYTDCNELLGENGEFRNVSVLSPDGLTKYTCILINPAPTSLRYDSLDPGKSNVIKIDSTIDRLMISWQNYAGETKKLPEDPTKLLDESTWSSRNTHYPPLLRVTIYPIANSIKPLEETQKNSRTYFFYPLAKDGNNKVTEVPFNNEGYKRQPQPVYCNKTDVGDFVGSADLACNVIINNGFDANAAQGLVVRITPLYTQAKVVIKANSGNHAVSFVGNQIIVDVSAKSGSSVRRLQARVSANISGDTILPSEDDIPEHAIRSAVTLCKRLIVPEAGGPVTIESGSLGGCPVKLD